MSNTKRYIKPPRPSAILDGPDSDVRRKTLEAYSAALYELPTGTWTPEDRADIREQVEAVLRDLR